MKNKLFVTNQKQAAHADEIGKEMLSSGLCADFVEKVLVRAKYYEGVYDLMVLWSEEDALEERERIVVDLTEEIQEVGKDKL